MTRRRPGFTLIELLAVILLISVLISLLLPAVQASREAARRAQCSNNLMQLGLATRSYETTHRVLPPGVVDRSGPVIEVPTAYQFSWIAQLLPYLEQNNTYRHLDFRQGVYHPANDTVRTTILSVLLCPSEASAPRNAFAGINTPFGPGGAPAQTTYAACHHDAEAPIDADNRGVFFLNSRTRYDEIEDGLSHTIFYGEKRPPGQELGWASGSRATLRNAGTPINETHLVALDILPLLPSKTSEEVEDPEAPGIEDPSGAAKGDRALIAEPESSPNPIEVGGFGSAHPAGSNFCFGDGSVRLLRSTINLRVYRLLAARNDGQPIGDDEF